MPAYTLADLDQWHVRIRFAEEPAQLVRVRSELGVRDHDRPEVGRYGVNVIRRALEEPLRQIARNCGAEGAIVVGKVREGTGGFGYNGASGEYEDLVKAGAAISDGMEIVRGVD